KRALSSAFLHRGPDYRIDQWRLLMSTPDPSRPGHNILMSRRTRPRLNAVDVHCGVLLLRSKK
ncbi:MAG: hypothetical protein M3P26_15365, partial [Gemmatimonadota bacterium]|nr:hypothetical protein [Gemmatimonadota bacterium]